MPELPEPESQVGHRKFYLYSTAQRYYLVARSKDRSAWSILKFNRDPELPTCLDVVEDPVTYSERECASLLTQIGAGNKAHGGLTFEVTVWYRLSRARRCTLLLLEHLPACTTATQHLGSLTVRVRLLLQADAVVGCFSLLQGCYLLLVTKKRLHGSVCGEGPISKDLHRHSVLSHLPTSMSRLPVSCVKSP